MLVSAAGLLAAGLISACGTLTTDFVFVTSAKAAGSNNYGEIDIFEINSESGHMRPIPASPVPSGGRNPVAEAVSTDYSTLFVVNEDDNTLVQFVIGSDGKLYPYNTINTPGIAPIGVAVSKTMLFVLDTYQPLPTCTNALPCSGSVSVLPLKAATSTEPLGLGSPVTNTSNGSTYWPLNLPSSIGNPADVIVPTAVTFSGSYLYVAAYDATTATKAGYIFAYTVGSTGALAPVTGSPFAAGRQPSSLSAFATSTGSTVTPLYLYAADATANKVLGYSISATGALTALSGSPYAAGNAPSAIVADPNYNFVYVANSTDDNVTAYSASSGVLTRIATYSTGLNPVAIGIDPSAHHFLYTADFLGGTVSDWQLSATDGTLMLAQGSPTSTNANPTAVAAVPHQ